MKKCKMSLLSFLLIIQFSYALARQSALAALNEGEEVPDIEMEIQIGNKVEAKKLSDFRDRLILLDFWGVDCVSCCENLPKMQMLQRMFQDRIKIIIVTNNNKEQAEKLWESLRRSSPRAKEIINAAEGLPFLYSDSIFYRLFPHKVIPLHAWIDVNGIFRALTNAETTTITNITRFLERKEVKLARYHALPDEFKREDPMSWLDGKFKKNDKLISYSLLLGRIPDINAPSLHKVVDSVTMEVVGLSIMNAPITDLYKIAYFKGELVQDYHVSLEVDDSIRYYLPIGSDSIYYDWLDSNTFCYGLKVRPGESKSAFQVMAEDLNEKFGLDTYLERRSVKCLVLKVDKLRFQYVPSKEVDPVKTRITKAGDLLFQLSNVRIGMLMEQLQALIRAHDMFLPLIDETNYGGKLNVELPLGLTIETAAKIPLARVRNALQNQGFILQEELREVEKIVIKKKRGKLQNVATN